jgi:hypothetical protein
MVFGVSEAALPPLQALEAWGGWGGWGLCSTPHTHQGTKMEESRTMPINPSTWHNAQSTLQGVNCQSSQT